MIQSNTTIAIMLGVLFLSLLLFFGSLSQLALDCRKAAMAQKYSAIEIQGICK